MSARTKETIASATRAVERQLALVSYLNCQRDALASKWNMEAQKHEISAREIDDEQDEERTLHLETARTLRQCASDLLYPDQALKPDSNINECPSCRRMFVDGETCSRGGCPMGGDV